MTEQITLFECVEATRDRGVVGEKQNILTCDVAAIGGEDVVLNGPARGGKDEILNSVEWLWHEIPDTSTDIDWEDEYYSGTQWYHWPSSISPKAPFYNAKVINLFPIQRFADFTSIDEVIEGIAKSFGEGEAATHEKVDVSMGGDSHEQLEKMVLDAPRASFFTIAADNDKIDFQNDFEEMRKRVLVLDTDASEDLTRQIQIRQGEIRSGLYEPNINEDRLEEIRDHHNNIPIGKFVVGDGEIVDPVSHPIIMQEPVPAKFVEGRFDNLKLVQMLEGVTLFHHDRRMKVPGQISDSGNDELYVTPADAFYSMKIFGENMVLSALNLKELDRMMLEEMRENPNSNYTVQDMMALLNAEGLNPTERQIRNSLDNMYQKTYVEKDADTGTRVNYRAAWLGTKISLDGSEILNWNEVIDDTIEVAKETMSGSRAEKYIEQYCKGDALVVTHPITGEEIDIREDDELEEKINDGSDGIEDAMNTPLHGSDKDDDDSEETKPEAPAPEPEQGEPVQGTL